MSLVPYGRDSTTGRARPAQGDEDLVDEDGNVLGGGGGGDLATVLAAGNTTGGTNVVLSGSDTIRGADNASGTGTRAQVRGGDSTGSNGAGGDASFVGGIGNGSGNGGVSEFLGGEGGATGDGGAALIYGGDGGSTSGDGGAVELQGGEGDTDGAINIATSSGSAINLGRSGVTIDVPSGATLDATGATVTGLDGADGTAIHDNTAGEIAALTLVTAASGDHVLIEDASDSNNKKRVAASDFLGGGGGTAPTLLKCKSNSSSASLDDTEAAITWAAAAIDQLGGAVTVSGSVITIVTTGVYKFTVTLRTDSSNRTELFIRTYIDTGSGYVQDTDEIVSDYVSRDSDQDTGAVTLVTALSLTAGDDVQFRGFGDTDGTCVILDPGTIMLIEAY